jgi:ribosomal protein S18 acetylase RimI-like enzyme
MQIRDAGPADRDAVVAVWSEAHLTRPWNDPFADFDRALAGDTSTVLVGVDGGRPVAVAMVGDDGHRGWIYYVAVAAHRRGQGLGVAIVHAAEDWLRARGCPKVQLMVRTENEEVAGFYRAMDYEHTEVLVLGKFL